MIERGIEVEVEKDDIVIETMIDIDIDEDPTLVLDLQEDIVIDLDHLLDHDLAQETDTIDTGIVEITEIIEIAGITETVGIDTDIDLHLRCFTEEVDMVRRGRNGRNPSVDP